MKLVLKSKTSSGKHINTPLVDIMADRQQQLEIILATSTRLFIVRV